eukprot:TRINITY_DN35842_c0_g1_i1.p1 TRINITY_DN35842_c0_g1~~TRINITY_DN35842_c0_g1_i1.p1  ORF type:complete len:491 (+),score=75.43 TRINITY_DN35842_c0_g1_i1:140-1474(+)
MLLGTTAIDRASDKLGKSWARPPQLPRPEAMPPAGRSTNCHPPGWHRSVVLPLTATHVDEQFLTAGHLSARPIYGHVPDESFEPEQRSRAQVRTEVNAELDDETSRFLRNFISRARGPGPHRLPGLIARMRQTASMGQPGAEELSYADFHRFTMAEGLCRCNIEIETLFRHFSGGGQSVRVEDLATLARGSLEPHRAAIVREVWNRLDPNGDGCVKVKDLLQEFDVQRLPDVRFGVEDVEGARRKLLEGLGVSMPSAHDRYAEFILEESAGRRRPRPVGAAGGGPVSAPAGTTVVMSRKRGDATQEIAGRPPAHDMEALVYWADWEAYFTILSVGIMNDDTFEKILRDPLVVYQIHGRAQAGRLIMQPKPKERPCEMRLLGHFEDGSKRVLILRNDDGLEHLSGSAGTGDGQFWTWGPAVHAEVVRRFLAEGHVGLKSVELKPF